MSNNEQDVEEITADLRGEDMKAAAATVKHVLAKPPLVVDDVNKPLTAADVLKLSQDIEASVRKQIAEAKFDAGLAGQVLPKRAAPITDFSKVTLDQVYDLDFPIEAKPFMSADGLAISLKDANYEPRWVNKNPQRIGELMGKGFTYIEPNDLHDEASRKAIQPSLDADGHYSINDVVAMKIDKDTYYRALRFAHERAVGLTKNTEIHKRAARGAQNFMRRSDVHTNADGSQYQYNSNDYEGAKQQGKLEFYSPDVTI